MKKGLDSASYEKRADTGGYIYFHKQLCGKEITITPHFHNSIEVALCVKGKCCICIDGTEHLLEEGDGVFIDRFNVHYYKYFPDSEYYVLLASEKFLDDDNCFNKMCLPEFLPKCENYEKIRQLFDDMYEFYNADNIAIKKGIANLILGILSSYYPIEKRKPSAESKVLVKALLYINENFKEDITLESISKMLGYSKNYFSFLFNKFTGMNLREYVNRKRICEFERLRNENPDLPVYICIEKSGFSGSKTFYRAYEKYKKKS